MLVVFKNSSHSSWEIFILIERWKRNAMKTDLDRVNRVIYYVLLSFFETLKQDE